MVGETTIGPDALVERFLSEYGLAADSWPADLAENDTDRLLLALLLEQRGETGIAEAVDNATTTGSGSETETGDYWSTEGSISLGGDWQPIEFEGLVSSSVDLRISNAAAQVRFVPPGQENATVGYAPAESPIVGIPVETGTMWARTDPDASSNASIDVQAWG